MFSVEVIADLCFTFCFCSETSRETGFHQSTRLCLEQIREALLHHRWEEAAEYMACYPQMLEDTTNGTAQQYKGVGFGFFLPEYVFVSRRQR